MNLSTSDARFVIRQFNSDLWNVVDEQTGKIPCPNLTTWGEASLAKKILDYIYEVRTDEQHKKEQE